MCGIAAPLLKHVHIAGIGRRKVLGRLRSEFSLEGGRTDSSEQITGGEEENHAEFAEGPENAEKSGEKKARGVGS
jgi:hypothetical protein